MQVAVWFHRTALSDARTIPISSPVALETSLADVSSKRAIGGVSHE